MSAVKTEKTMELVVGENSFVLSLPESTIEIADWEVSPSIDISMEIEKAFDHPIDFPALAHAIVADDRIALAIEPGLPQMMAIVDGVVHVQPMRGSVASNLQLLTAHRIAS